ncbi:MAG: hypothetical protein KJN64_11905 [Ignavibacteria bacterium]|nr:hypothetical protein [Ignavibacteria bacterium]MBT8381654.1 hypothetical protein [Ignavibacteria bacterium]MBT8391330.1 hypothetical protein [Ignavibacteria bacterium]NNJ52805.1 hypothetical protein [Ignavibacteriaceae bacterium]NNL20567.1 hypothetical protein [Ignavibacteriaceae bacterium]
MITQDISNSWVMDQGYFRNIDLPIKIKSAAENEFFIVTEDALVEMFKSDKWEKTSTNSLSIIKEFKEKILVTNPIGLLREKELKSMKACHDFVDIQSTKLFRNLLDVYNTSTISEIKEVLQEDISRTQAYKSNKVLNHEKNKDLYLSIVKQFQDQMGPTLRNDLRKNKVKLEDIYQIILDGIEECFRNPRGEFKDMSKNELNCFIESKPVYYFLYTTLVFESFYWQQKLGLEQINPQKVTNYILDTNYIIIALYSKGILSNDRFMNEMYNHLKNIIEIKFGVE